MYSIFNNATNDSESLTNYVAKQSKSYSVNERYGETILTSNNVLDTINFILKPYIRIGGTATDYNPDEYHKLSDFSFSIEELSILGRNGILDKLIPDNNSKQLKKIDAIYYGSYSTDTTPSSLKSQSLEFVMKNFMVLIIWLILLFFVFRGTSMILYTTDYLFVRYKWTNESSIVGRKLLAILLNISLLISFISTIIAPFLIDVYYYGYDRGGFLDFLGISVLCAITVFIVWILTSLGWWVFGRTKEQSTI